MIDDDEVANPDWIDRMLYALLASGADVVGGPVQCEFEIPLPGWAMTVPFFHPRGAISNRATRNAGKGQVTEGTVQTLDGPIGATGNVLMRSAALVGLEAPLFDPDFGLSGGEDKEAFIRLWKAGLLFAWSSEELVTEFVPANRISKEWVLARSYRTGNTDMRISILHPDLAGSPYVELLKAGALMSAAGLGWMLFPFHDAAKFAFKVKVFRALGKLSAFLGARSFGYLTTDGR
jgi:hypothetical protein